MEKERIQKRCQNKETNKAIYKLKFDEKGVYDIEMLLLLKKEIIDRLPIKCYIGVPMPKTQEIESPVNITPNIFKPQRNSIIPKFCSYCGTKIKIGSQFCSNCGTKIKSI